MNQENEISLRDIYPEFSDAEIAEAETNIRRYLAVLIRIAERLQADGYTPDDLDLTLSGTESIIPDERSKKTLSNN